MDIAVKEFLKPSEVAEQLGVSTRTVLRMLEENAIPHTTVGKRKRIPATAWDKWLAARNDAALAQVKEAQS